jgi:tetratricopeptide (TPR) repeat protein
VPHAPAQFTGGRLIGGEVTGAAATLPPAMLYLLTSPAWAPAGQPARPLPLTLPAALLVVLASHAAWVSREQLAAVFWPAVAPPDALHHLRVNLHRARALLLTWGVADALQAERTRVQLALPSDLAQLRAAQRSDQAGLLSRLSPAQWLRGWRLPGNEGFAQWCDDTAGQLQADWLAADQRRQAAPGAASAFTLEPAAAPPGREAELHRLLASPAPALLLLGEPGAGKTTLLRAAYPLAPCLRGLEGLHAMSYRPLLDSLREQLPVLRRALREPSHPLRPYRLDLARVLPELAPDEPLPPLDALTAQTRLVEALARAFEALTPVLLVDDLQWCDSATVEWLLMLAHAGRLRWRAAARRHEISPALARALQSLRDAVRLEELDVPPLNRAALAQACSRLWPQQAFGEARLDRLQLLSGGNAFLVGELVAAGLTGDEEGTSLTVAERAGQLVRARLQALPADARRAVEAAAIFVQRVPAQALRHLAGLPGGGGHGGDARDASGASDAGGASDPGEGGAGHDPAWRAACRRASAAGLLDEDRAGLACRHDLIRQAVTAAMAPARRAALHRHAALWLATGADADALTIARHWQAAGEPQTALAWRHRGAEQLKARGRFDEARVLWREVADDSLDATQALRARLELAACDLFEDLERGETALDAVRAQLGAVADPAQRDQIEGRVLAALVDNRVFAGDIARARQHAARLRRLLPALPVPDRVDALEVLIELAMREPDIAAAWVWLAQLRELAPRRPTLLSFEGQIHWFGGQVQAAHDVLARLLERHPDYCRGITIENDLAVMLQALGRIDEAEALARRSLQSWAGVAHTEALSLLVLGLVLTSAGRHAEADAALQRALALAREQASPGFEAEALVRQARLWLQGGRVAAARQALARAALLLASSPEPLRVSQLVRQPHRHQRVRLARVHNALAAACGDWPAAAAAASEMAERARRAGLLEPLAEARLLQARASQRGGDAAANGLALAEAAATLAAQQGFADLRWRAAAWIEAQGAAGDRAAAARTAAALLPLLCGAEPPLFDAAAAACREPGWD